MARNPQSGISAVEIVVAAALLMVGAMMVPTLTESVRDQRAGAATRQIVSELRHAQSQALTTGWQVRLVGYPASATNGRANQYRMIGRASTASPWPDALGPDARSATQFATSWTDLSQRFPGVDLDPGRVGTEPFSITYDPRGAVVAREHFAPLAVVARLGDARARRISVGPAGKVTIR